MIRVVTRRRAATLAGTSFSQVTGDITMEYDVAGQLVKRRTPAVTYPSRNMGIAARRSIQVSPDPNPPYPLYPNNGSGYIVAADSALFQYAVTGGISSAINSDAQVSRTYNPNGQVSTETQRIRQTTGTDFTAHQYTVEYAYDRNGRQTGVRHPTQLGPSGNGNEWNRYSYDETGALRTVTDVLGNVIAHSYANDGSLVRIDRPGGSIEQFTYDLDGQRRHHTAQTLYGQFRDTRFGYDGRGKLVWSGNSVMRLDTMIATYSPLGHAVTGVQTQRLADQQRERTYETSPYDALGFRTHVIAVDSLYLLNGSGGVGDGSLRRERGDHFFYEAGTGRLRAGAAMSRDTFVYDADGNTEYNYTITHVTTGNERASYYGADGRIAAADYRISLGGSGAPFFTIEEYRYDALGRRVWVRARRFCRYTGNDGICLISKIRRTVWDGDREFYEIQMPGQNGSAHLENDINLTNSPWIEASGQYVDPNPFYGRVAYAYGHAIDQPLSIVRMGYEDRRDRAGLETTYWTAPPFATFPLWSHRGQADLGHDASGSLEHCISSQLCVRMTWPGAWFDLVRSSVTRNAWHGTLLEDKEDGAFTLYRRNRVYDARTGQFTQEDPIGLAGGLNAYGFANGDPVNFSDPYGLAAEDNAQPCRGRLSCALRGIRSATSAVRAWRTARALRRLQRSVRIVDRDGDVVEIAARSNRGDISIVTDMSRQGDDLVLRGTHIDGPGAGAIGREQLRAIAEELGRQQGARRVIVHGAERSTGLTRGRVPRPKIYEVPEL